MLKATVPYSQAKNGATITLPVGTYHVVERDITESSNYTLKSMTVTPESAEQVIGKDESKEIVFRKEYEKIVDSNNKYEIHHWNYNGMMLAQGNIPADFPAGTRVRLSFLCNNGDWLNRDPMEATYNGRTFTLQSVKEGNHAKFWVEYTLVQNQTLKIIVNADPNGKVEDRFIPNSVTIEPISSVNATSARKTRSLKIVPQLRAETQYEDKTVSGEGALPDTTTESKKYVVDEWSKEIILTKDTWDLVVTEGLSARDENGNPYYYFIDSAAEPQLRKDAIAVIDKDGENRLLVSENNLDTSLSLTNTLPDLTKDITIKKAGYEDDITQLTPLGDVTFQLLDGSAGFPEGDGTFVLTESEKATGHTISDLEIGKIYTLRETKAPAGYNKLVGDIQFQVTDDGIVLITQSEYITISDLNMFEITVINQAGVELPSAGGSGTHCIYLLGMLLAIGCSVMLIARKRAR